MCCFWARFWILFLFLLLFFLLIVDWVFGGEWGFFVFILFIVPGFICTAILDEGKVSFWKQPSFWFEIWVSGLRFLFEFLCSLSLSKVDIGKLNLNFCWVSGCNCESEYAFCATVMVSIIIFFFS